MRYAVVLLLVAAALLAAEWVCQVDPELCNGCGACLPYCPLGAISMSGMDAWIDPEVCNGCGQCMSVCPRNAIYRTWYTCVDTESDGEEVSWGPNPASAALHVHGAASGGRLRLFDACGRVVSGKTADGSECVCLDVDGLSPGAYVLVIDSRVLGPVSVAR